MRRGHGDHLLLYAPTIHDDQGKGALKHHDSGQVYTEVTCPGGPMTSDWAWKTRGSSREAGSYRSLGPGCSSLVNMAIRSAMYHSYSISAESLDGVPWEIAGKVWRRLVRSYAAVFKQRTYWIDNACRELDSLQVWKAFASTYPLELESHLKRRHQVVHRPNMRICDYTKPISSLTFDWITFLTLSNIQCPRTDLVQISQLPNIGILTIGSNVLAPDIGLDDGVVRSWARTAGASDAFSMLRVLNCRSQKHITQAIFDHLSRFPALALFNVEDCGLGSQHKGDAAKHGWKYRTGKLLSEWFASAGATGASWDSVMQACFHLGGPLSLDTLTTEGVEAIDELPRLHLSIGDHPPDAMIDVNGDRCMRSFHRISTSLLQGDDAFDPLCDKRSLDHISKPDAKKARTKPQLRTSKQQDINAFFLDFRP